MPPTSVNDAVEPRLTPANHVGTAVAGSSRVLGEPCESRYHFKATQDPAQVFGAAEWQRPPWLNTAIERGIAESAEKAAVRTAASLRAAVKSCASITGSLRARSWRSRLPATWPCPARREIIGTGATRCSRDPIATHGHNHPRFRRARGLAPTVQRRTRVQAEHTDGRTLSEGPDENALEGSGGPVHGMEPQPFIQHHGERVLDRDVLGLAAIAQSEDSPSGECEQIDHVP